MTPCEEMEINVGDYCVVLENSQYTSTIINIKGELVQLLKDDKSDIPWFNTNKNGVRCLDLNTVRKATKKELLTALLKGDL